MTVKIVEREVNPVIATHWYLEKILLELPLINQRVKKSNFFDLPFDFIKRQTTDIIADSLRRVQCLYSWEKNSYTGIVYREFHFNEIINQVLENNLPLNNLKSKVGEHSTVEHVIPVSVFKNQIFEFYKKGKLEESAKEIVKAFLSPVALISKVHTNKNNPLKIKDSDYDLIYPFKRYCNSGIKIYTHKGFEIDKENWTINDHWELLRNTEYFKQIMTEFKI